MRTYINKLSKDTIFELKRANDKKLISPGEKPEISNENFQKLIEEWQCALKGEFFRVTVRFELLKNNGLQELNGFFGAMRKCFHELYNDIRAKYWSEIENMKNICRVFHVAVENEKPIQKELIFVDDTFHINPEINLIDNALIIPELPKEVVEEGAFTTAQLSKLTDIFLDLCPSGYMLRSSFIFFLQDVIWNDSEYCLDSYVPDLWKKMHLQSLREVVDMLYDDLEYVYWRDFIIYNLRLKYPTERELLLVRRYLRENDPDATELVQDYHFYATKMWFEDAYKETDSKKLKNIKYLLGKMYSVKNYGINYTALLLDFCKDENIVLGFGKALELSLGKLISWNSTIGNTFEQEFLKKLREHDDSVDLRDKERAEYYRIVHDEVCKLVDRIVHEIEDVIITDIEVTPIPQNLSKMNEKLNKTISTGSSSLRKSRDSVNSNNSKEGKINSRSTTKGAVSSCKEVNKNDINMSDSTANRSKVLEQESQFMSIYQDLPNNVDTDASEFTQIQFFLSLDLLITVITAALPWHSKIQGYGDLSFVEQATKIYENCKNPLFNMAVLSHRFLNSDEFLNLLGKTKKFIAKDPVKIVKNIVDAQI